MRKQKNAASTSVVGHIPGAVEGVSPDSSERSSSSIDDEEEEEEEEEDEEEDDEKEEGYEREWVECKLEVEEGKEEEEKEDGMIRFMAPNL